MTMMNTEHWIEESGAAGRLLSDADRAAIRKFVMAHTACCIEGVSQLHGHLRVMDDATGVEVWWSCAHCHRMPGDSGRGLRLAGYQHLPAGC